MYHWWIPLSVVTAAAAAAFASVEIESYHTNGFLAEPVPQIARQVRKAAVLHVIGGFRSTS